MTSSNSSLIQNQDFIIFGEDFARHPHALEHLLKPMFEQNRFLWVETIGLRSPRLSWYDVKRIAEKMTGWLKPKSKLNSDNSKKTPKNIFIINPFMIPFNQFDLIRLFNQASVNRTVNKALKKYKFQNQITITSVPNACDYIGNYNEKLAVYYCVDEFSQWPGLDFKLVKKMEDLLLQKVQLIVATSDSLSASKKIPNSKTITLTHGVDFEHFNLKDSPRSATPFKVCYFGLFDERSDQKILMAIAKEISNCEIHIFGTTICDVSHLSTIPNIKFHGKVDYANLPTQISDMNAFILPYTRNAATENINPLKLKEYLSTGRPVLATPLPEILKLKEYLLVCETPQDFVSTIQDLQNQKKIDTSRTLTYLQQNETWLKKAEIFSAAIRQGLTRTNSL